MRIKNFGKNVDFTPKYYYEPKSEDEILDILNKHKGEQIRAVGSGHAWSKGIESKDVFVGIKKLNFIGLDNDTVVVGGGTKLKDLVSFVTKNNLMLPAMGGIMEQSVAGLASTGTHGTGSSSFSDHVESLRIAGYGENGVAKIYDYTEGDRLKAARTSMGLMGIIVSMRIKCVPRYFIKESSKMFNTLDEVLKEEKEWPLSQSVIIPYAWKFLSFRRKKVESRSLFEAVKAYFGRITDFVAVEIMPHLILKFLLIFENRNSIVNYYKNFLPSLLFGVTNVNEDYKGLTLHTRHHYYFTHVEMEAFVKESKIREVFPVMKDLVEWFAGTGTNLSQRYKEELKDIRGKFVLHYPMFIRKVYPDDTLISMTACEESYYAIGFFTYKKNKDRGGYWFFTEAVARILSRDFDVRFHWGKHFPLEYEEIKHLYPEIEKFKSICREVDSEGSFQNDFTKKVFGV